MHRLVLALTLATLTGCSSAPRVQTRARFTPHALAVAPDGHVAASGLGGEVLLLDEEGASTFLVETPGLFIDDVRALAFSPDGERLAIAFDDRVLVRRMITGAILWDRLVVADSASAIMSMAFTPDGGRLVLGLHDDGGFQVRSASTGQLEARLPLRWRGQALADFGGRRTQSMSIFRLVVTDEVAIGGTLDCSVMIAPLDGSAPRGPLRCGNNPRAVAVHGDEALALSEATFSDPPRTGLELRRWSLASGEAVGAPIDVQGEVVGLSPDGERLLVQRDGDLELRSVRDGALLATLGEPAGDVRRAAFSPRGDVVATICEGGAVERWVVR